MHHSIFSVYFSLLYLRGWVDWSVRREVWLKGAARWELGEGLAVADARFTVSLFCCCDAAICTRIVVVCLGV